MGRRHHVADAARSAPLFDLGGLRLALLVPMVGSVLAALATADIARQVSGDRCSTPTRTFWIVGLASPMAIYALDLWEHAPGAGFMVAGVALLVRAVDRVPPVWLGVAAGGCFGLAGSMRSEAYIVLFVALAGACSFLVHRRAVGHSLWLGVSASLAFGAVFLGNDRLESVLGGNSRVARAEGRATSDTVANLGDRAQDALLTWFGGSVGGVGIAVATGVVLAALLIVGVRLADSDPRASRLALGAAGAALFVMILSGRGFVPGALVASPVAVLAFARRPRVGDPRCT